MAVWLVIAPLVGFVLAALYLCPLLSAVPPDLDTDIVAMRAAAARAFFWFVPAIVLWLLLDGSFEPRYGVLLLYLRYLTLDYGFWVVIPASLALFTNRRLRRDAPASLLYLAHLAFVAVLISLFSIVLAVRGDAFWSLHDWLFRPLLLAAIVAIVPAGLTAADRATVGGPAILGVLGFLPVVSLVPTAVDWLRSAWACAFFALCLAAFGFFLRHLADTHIR